MRGGKKERMCNKRAGDRRVRGDGVFCGERSKLHYFTGILPTLRTQRVGRRGTAACEWNIGLGVLSDYHVGDLFLEEEPQAWRD